MLQGEAAAHRDSERKMTEKEKMEHQKLYNANYDKELEEERIRCKRLCQKYSTLPIEDLEERRAFIKTILGEFGSGSIVTRDIPSNSVAVGNPCRVIRQITDDDRRKSWDR